MGLWDQFLTWLLELKEFLLGFLRSKPTITLDEKIPGEGTYEESTIGEEILDDIKDEDELQCDFEDLNEKPILNLNEAKVNIINEKTSKTSNVSDVSETVYKNLSNQITTSFEEISEFDESIKAKQMQQINDGMSNYTLDFESDSDDENKGKQAKQTEECLNNYRGAFNNYREIKLELKEVAQTVEIEGLGNYVTDRKQLRLSKSNKDIGKNVWTESFFESKLDLTNVQWLVDGCPTEVVLDTTNNDKNSIYFKAK